MRVLLPLMLVGCSTIPPGAEFDRGPNPPTAYRFLAPSDLREHCGLAEACTDIPANAGEVCRVYLPVNFDQRVKRHEDYHCRFGMYHQYRMQ